MTPHELQKYLEDIKIKSLTELIMRRKAYDEKAEVSKRVVEQKAMLNGYSVNWFDYSLRDKHNNVVTA